MGATKKLYIVTRADLRPGMRAAQSCHALSLYAKEHPEDYARWMKGSNNLVVLEVDNEDKLVHLAWVAKQWDVLVSRFREPDLDHALTAIALDGDAKPIVSNIRLALRDAA